MRVQRQEIKKPNSERVRFSITEMKENEYNTICKALELMQDDKEAAAMLHTFNQIKED